MKENQVRAVRRRDSNERVVSCNVELIVEDNSVLLDGTWDKSGLSQDRENFNWAVAQGVWWANRLSLPLVVVSEDGAEILYRRPSDAS